MTHPAKSTASEAALDGADATDLRRNPTAKALRVLEVMASQPTAEYGVRELAAKLGMSASTLFRILVLLEREQWLSADAETRRYRLGARFLKMTFEASDHHLWRTALDHISRLVEECDETTLLALYDPIRMQSRFVAAVESRQAVRYVADVQNQAAPIHAGASGLAILAFLPEQDRRTVIAERGLPALTDQTITEVGRLEEEIVRIREQGFACTAGQRTPGAVGIAAPIIGAGSRVIGSVVLTIPEYRFDAKRELDLGVAVARCAEAIGVSLRVTSPALGEARS